MNRIRRSIAVPAAVAIAVAALAGCSSNDSGGVSAASTICFITGTDSVAYGVQLNSGFNKAAKAAGYDVLQITQNFDPQKGADALNTCISRDVKGIVLWPVDPHAYLAGLTAASAANIPVTIVNSPVDAKSAKLVKAASGPDNRKEGALAAEALNTALKGKGNILVIEGQPGNGTTVDRTGGFMTELKSLGSSLKVIDTVTSNFDAQTALVASRDVITRYGADINGVFADDQSAPGFIQAWKESGQTGAVPLVVGIGGQQDAFAAIKSGAMFATILQSPIIDGQQGFAIMEKVLKNTKVTYDNPIEVTVVDKTNVDSLKPAF